MGRTNTVRIKRTLQAVGLSALTASLSAAYAADDP